MATENFEKAGEIFEHAIEIEDPAERKRYLDGACKGDPELRAEVEILLEAHEEAGEFLEVPHLAAGVTYDATPLPEMAGAIIGRYKLLEKIGEGGMAVVYMAEQQEPVRRRVALKIIKLGMDTRSVIARFEAERQALAMMDHPNIAKVLDAGTTDTGRPYFVMDLVRGISITEYCDKNNLNTKERLALFSQVCSAVQHAHQKGIIHRDIKPANVMVTLQDSRPVPMVIDFGIAKATNQQLTEKTLFTRYAHMIGTPGYMSPEQAEMGRLDVDTRSDIYSLGVLLYELLTGTLPFNPESLREAGYAEIQRVIREEEPDKPSTRLSTMGEALTEVAKRRKTNPESLTKLVRGDLDWIVMKSLEKDRTRRYDTAAELAADIERHFRSELVLARAPTMSYVLRQFIRRHRASVTAGLLIAAALGVGLVIATYGLMEARQQRNRAVDALEKEAIAHKQTEQALYFNRIDLAEEYYLDSNIGRVRSLLWSCPDDLRGWEWYYLWQISNQALRTLRGHEHVVCSVAFNPTGRRIVTGSLDHTLKLWDAETGRELTTLRGHEGMVEAVAYSSDGKRIVSASQDNTLRLWDAGNGRALMTLRGHEGWVFSVAFSPDGTKIVSGSNDQTLKVWDAGSGRELMTLRGHDGGVKSVAFSPDGNRIVSGSEDRTLKVWDANSGSELMTLHGHERIVTSVAFSLDGQRIVSGSMDNSLRVWNAKNGNELMTLEGHRREVESVAFSPDGTKIASGSYDNTLKVWDANDGSEMMTLHGHAGAVSSVAFSPDSKWIVSGSADNTAKIWPVQSSGKTTIFRAHERYVSSVAFSPDGRRIVSGSGDGTVKVWDAASDTEQMTLRGHEREVTSVAFSPDGECIASSGDSTVRLWDAEDGTEQMSLQGHEKGVTSAIFSPDSKHIASGSGDSTVKIWDAGDGAEQMTLRGHQGVVTSVAYSPDGKRLASGGVDKTLRVWDADSGRELMTLQGHEGIQGYVQAVAFSPDGKRIVSGSGDKTLKVWDAKSGRDLMTLKGHAADIRSVAFSPDGRRIISCGRDNTLKVWDAASGTEVMTIRGPEGRYIRSIAFSPNGRRIVSGSTDGTITIWGMADSSAIEPSGEDAQ